MKIKKIQWKSEKQKTRVILIFVVTLIGSYGLFNRIQINKSWRRTYENRPSIQAITYDEAVDFYASQGYICEVERDKYTNSTICEFPNEDQYPSIDLWSNKNDDLLLISIESDTSTVQISEIALNLFVDMSSEVLSMPDEDKSNMEEWIITKVEENTSQNSTRDNQSFNGEYFQFTIYDDRLDMQIGSQIRY